MNALRPPRPRWLRAALSAAALVCMLPASACRRPRSAIDWETKVPYAHGTVLKHVPTSCPGGQLYFDLQAVLANEATAAPATAFGEKIGGELGDTVAKREALRALRKALAQEGIVLLRDTREVAICWREGESLVLVAGGEFSGKDVLGALRTGIENGGEAPPKLLEEGGVPFLRLTELLVARPAPNVVVVTEERSLLGQLRTPTDRSASWNVKPGRILSMRYAGSERFEVAVDEQGEDLLVEGRVPTEEEQTVLEGLRERVGHRLLDTPLKILSQPVLDMKIEVKKGMATLTIRAKTRLVADVIRAVSELPPGELKKILGYVLAPEHDGGGTAPGGGGQKI